MLYKQVPIKFDRGKLPPVHIMKAYIGAWVQLHLFVTPALDQDGWSASRSAHWTPRKRVCSTQWIEGWLGPTARLTFLREKSLASARNQTLNHPAGDLLTILTMPGMSKMQPFYLCNATSNLTSGTWNTIWNLIIILSIFIQNPKK